MTFPTQCSNVLQIEGALKWSWYDLQATQLQNRFFNWETLKQISKRLNTKGEVVKPQSHNSAIYDFAGGSGLPIVWRRAFAPVSLIRTFFIFIFESLSCWLCCFLMSHGKETSSWEVFEKVQLAIASKCRQLSTRPLRIFRVECIGGAAAVSNWVTITMRRGQHTGECARGRGQFQVIG